MGCGVGAATESVNELVSGGRAGPDRLRRDTRTIRTAMPSKTAVDTTWRTVAFIRARRKNGAGSVHRPKRHGVFVLNEDAIAGGDGIGVCLVADLVARDLFEFLAVWFEDHELSARRQRKQH